MINCRATRFAILVVGCVSCTSATNNATGDEAIIDRSAAMTTLFKLPTRGPSLEDPFVGEYAITTPDNIFVKFGTQAERESIQRLDLTTKTFKEVFAIDDQDRGPLQMAGDANGLVWRSRYSSELFVADPDGSSARLLAIFAEDIHHSFHSALAVDSDNAYIDVGSNLTRIPRNGSAQSVVGIAGNGGDYAIDDLSVQGDSLFYRWTDANDVGVISRQPLAGGARIDVWRGHALIRDMKPTSTGVLFRNYYPEDGWLHYVPRNGGAITTPFAGEAGNYVVDGDTVYLNGKMSVTTATRIFKTSIAGGTPTPLYEDTSLDSGPLLYNGALVVTGLRDQDDNAWLLSESKTGGEPTKLAPGTSALMARGTTLLFFRQNGAFSQAYVGVYRAP